MMNNELGSFAIMLGSASTILCFVSASIASAVLQPGAAVRAHGCDLLHLQALAQVTLTALVYC